MIFKYYIWRLIYIAMVTLQTVVSRKKEGLLVSELGKEIVMMDIDNGNYLGLNETGTG